MAFGAGGVQFAEDFIEGMVNVRFAKRAGDDWRTVSVTMKIPDPPKHSRRGRHSTKSELDRREQMARATYRALHDWLKAQFVAIEFGLLSFEDVFLSHFEWMIDGQRTTVGRMIIPRLSNDHLLPSPSIGETT
jgi:hypothetical protein